MWTFGNPVCDDEATNIVDGAYHLVHRGDTLVVHVHISGVARGGGGGFNPPHCEKMCIFYCLVFEQKTMVKLLFLQFRSK